MSAIRRNGYITICAHLLVVTANDTIGPICAPFVRNVKIVSSRFSRSELRVHRIRFVHDRPERILHDVFVIA